MRPRKRTVRLLTAAAVVALGALGVTRGWSIVQFAEARAAGDAGGEALRSWVGAPGLTGAALAATLSRMALASDKDAARQREDALTAMLATRPMSATDWLSLAGMRFVTGEPYRDVLAALAMSSVTGANEDAVMQPRAIFGLLQWDVLPAAARRRTIQDLVGPIVDGTVSDGTIELAAKLLKAKPEAARSEIAGLLGADGVAAPALARLGL